jgi:DNA-binding NtrC family response regulator
MFTGSRDVKSAVRAAQLGAFDYLTKPVKPEEIKIVVRRALEARDLRLGFTIFGGKSGRTRAKGWRCRWARARAVSNR